MRWDPVRRVYIDESGRVIPAKEIRRHIDKYIDSEQADVEDEVNAFLEKQQSGLETAGKAALVSVLFVFLADKIRQWHHVAGTIAYGGENQLNAEREARIAEKVQSELAHLVKFEQAVENALVATEAITEGLSKVSSSLTQGETLIQIETTILNTAPSEVSKALEQIVADTLKVEADEAAKLVRGALSEAQIADLNWGTISPRAQLYTESLYSTYENNVAAREVDAGASLGRRVCEEDTESCEECVDAASTFFEPIENIPEIGSLQCMSNCRCFFEFAEPNPSVNVLIEQ